MTEKVDLKKKPEGSELDALPDFRDWGKEGETGPEPEAAPPAINEVVESKGTAIAATEESESFIELEVRKAAYVMHHSVVAAAQILAQETGANQSVIDMDMQPAIPAALLYQMATPLAKAMFDKVYTDHLSSKVVFEVKKLTKK